MEKREDEQLRKKTKEEQRKKCESHYNEILILNGLATMEQEVLDEHRPGMFMRKWILISFHVQSDSSSQLFNINFLIICSKSNKSFSCFGSKMLHKK